MKKEMWIHTHAEEYYSVLKKEILSLVTTWMNLDVTVVKEISHTETEKRYLVSLIYGI